MKSRTIHFNINGYDGFIDFIKAYAILCVLFGHTFVFLDAVGYGIWAGMQVPLFILVQVFHCYKKERPHVGFTKVIKRVLVPFIVFEICTFGLAILFGNDGNWLFIRFLNGEGYGPGSYFPWVYLQIALLLPLLSVIIKKYSKQCVILLFLLVSEGFELLFSYLNISENVFRLLCPHYFFLICLGWLWAKEGIKINRITILISIISLFSIIYFEYFSVDDEPWFFKTGFVFHRWPCYFFVAYGFTALLHLLWKWLSKYQRIVKMIQILANASYEIFLVQMSSIFLIHTTTISFVSSEIVNYVLGVAIIWTISLFGGIYLNMLLNNKGKNNIRVNNL